MPFRPWTFTDGDRSRVSNLTNPERKSDDRSPYVRYARSAALWAEWVRDGIIQKAEEPQNPTLDVDGIEYTFGLLPISALTTTMTLPPSAKEHRQRVLEGVLAYADPIIIVESSSGYHVIGNHDVFEAAKSYSEEMARPGRIRSSDLCLVALAPASLLDQLDCRSAEYETKIEQGDIEQNLIDNGYTLSPRADDPTWLSVFIGNHTYTNELMAGSEWQTNLSQAIGVRTLNLGSNTISSGTDHSGKKIVLTLPKLAVNILEKGTEYPFGTLPSEFLTLSGAMMWSLRDF